MSTAQPFPVLASANNSRSASPASSPPAKAAAQRSTKSASKGSGGYGKPRARKSQGPTTGSGGEAAAGRRKGNSKKQTAVAVAGRLAPLSTATDSGLLAADNRQQQRKPKAPAQQQKAGGGGRRSTAEPVPVEAVQAPASSSGSLPTAVIVAGENGRARVLFNPPPPLVVAPAVGPHEYEAAADSPPPQFVGKPRFPASSLQLRRSSMSHYGGGGSHMHYAAGDGLGLSSTGAAHKAPATARSVTTPPEFRQRSMTSTQLRVSAPVFTPQQQQQQQQQYYHYQDPPMSAPAYDGRGRSQSVSTHVSLTGLRISMAQSRPGNVLAPHLPLLSRASSGGPVVQTNTYANGGYFATRRASVSNVGLAADLSHSIRIPAVLFQKHADRRSADPAEPGSAGGDAEASDESPAMKRLQEMISSMRALGSAPPTPRSAESLAVDNVEEDLLLASPTDASSDPGSEPVVSQAAPATHPTSRFDSILEEDEDADDDEANLDADDGSVTVTDAHDRAAALDRPKTLFALAGGAFAALGSVSAKLAVDQRTGTLALAVAEMVPGADLGTVMLVTRGAMLAAIGACNFFMWLFFTKALRYGRSTARVMMLQTVANFATTALCGVYVFGDVLGLRWWMGASLIAAGLALLNSADDVVVEKKES
ncbi:hypothetical protein GGI20_000332 [Coemansia sp. BCRC 34301]|nr:hypothetical protein GGI20_000332 [Coemansia sp. BCRC 34301]